MEEKDLAVLYYDTWADMQMFRRNAFGANGLLLPTRMQALIMIYRKKVCSLKDLCALLGIKSPAGSAMIGDFVELGLVSREISSADRREVLISLTEAGLDVARKEMKKRIHLLGEQLYNFSEKNRKELFTALKKLREIHRSLDLPYLDSFDSLDSL